MWKPSWSRRMPGAPLPRSRAASISLRPTPTFWASGAIVIGPMPRMGSRSSMKFEPTTRPSTSATTPQTWGCGNPHAHHPGGRLERREVALKAVMVVDRAECVEHDLRARVGVGRLDLSEGDLWDLWGGFHGRAFDCARPPVSRTVYD